jgi:hypothetical protein
VQSHDWLAGGDKIAIVHEPLHDSAAMRGKHLVALAKGVDRADGLARDECIARLSL